MKIFEAILLALLSTSLIVIFAMGYQNTMVDYVRNRIRRFRAKRCIKKLENAGYLNLTPRGKMNSSRKGLIRACQNCRDFKKVWNCMDEIEFDYRSFSLEMQDHQLELDHVKLNKTLNVLGLEMGVVQTLSNNDQVQHQFNIGETSYNVEISPESNSYSDLVFTKFSESINSELEKIGSDERTYILGENPMKMVFLNPQLHQIIMN
ncbi:hypothetical protein KFE94_00425 [bacterium SCSIO 12643]|nr:hypothetical protein KFE94_00425 [bacterium SCSIO 12643]